MGVSLARHSLGPASFVELQQIIHVHLVGMTPPLMIGAAGASILWTILIRRRRRGVELRLVSAASAATVCAAVLTGAVNLPINQQLMSWSREAPPANVMALWSPWETAHSIRTVLAIVAFVSQVVALGAAAAPAARPPVGGGAG